ncbi:MAG: hypothetical protein KDG57_00510, partial [Rhodoferax sp.]|nr:hypothetical protein [Rhodoferax sp.]
QRRAAQRLGPGVGIVVQAVDLGGGQSVVHGGFSCGFALYGVADCRETAKNLKWFCRNCNIRAH